MTEWVELNCVGNKLAYVRVRTIERIELPPSLGAEDPAPPETPILVYVRERQQPLAVHSISAHQLLFTSHPESEFFVDVRNEERGAPQIVR